MIVTIYKNVQKIWTFLCRLHLHQCSIEWKIHLNIFVISLGQILCIQAERIAQQFSIDKKSTLKLKLLCKLATLLNLNNSMRLDVTQEAILEKKSEKTNCLVKNCNERIFIQACLYRVGQGHRMAKLICIQSQKINNNNCYKIKSQVGLKYKILLEKKS